MKVDPVFLGFMESVKRAQENNMLEEFSTEILLDMDKVIQPDPDIIKAIEPFFDQKK